MCRPSTHSGGKSWKHAVKSASVGLRGRLRFTSANRPVSYSFTAIDLLSFVAIEALDGKTANDEGNRSCGASAAAAKRSTIVAKNLHANGYGESV
jgi:hypothetical protein